MKLVNWVRGLPDRVRAFYIYWGHREEYARIDHSRMYLWVHIGLPMVGLGIVLRPRMVGLPTISPDSNRLLGLLIVWGSGLCLIAACMGVGWFVRRAKTDKRIPYASGAFGQLSVVVSLVFYLWVLIFQAGLDFVQILELGLTFTIAMACLHIDVVVIKEIWRVTHIKKHPDCPHWPAPKR